MRPEDREGGEVVPFPSGPRHPSEWPVEPAPSPRGYCFFCDAPATADPCPSCGRALWESAELGGPVERGPGEEGHPAGRHLAPSPRPSVAEGERPEAPFNIEDEGLDRFTSERYLTATTDEYRGLAEEMARASEQQHEPQPVAATMPGIESGIVGFDDVTGETAPALEEQERSDLAVRVGTGVVLGALFLGALWLGGGWFLALVTVVATMALGELYATLRRRRYAPAALFGLLGGIGIMVAAWRAGPAGVGGVLAVTMAVVFLWYALGLVRRDPLVNGSVTLLGVAWIPGLIAFALPMLQAERFRTLILAMVALTVAGDAGSYFVGRSLGRRALAPRLSPHKTVEGLAGGTIVALAAGALLAFLDPFDLGSGLLLATVVAIFGPLGDLAESMVKRALDVKDMGSVLPGHGGLLDRIDALIFVIPATYFLYRWLGLLG
ncbi:MAG: phosphatidate cytidylyltransferase [Actinomycetota bacterium]|nr:phosphatidate cytidylyltransferase [Actinomycetota bacterium]